MTRTKSRDTPSSRQPSTSPTPPPPPPQRSSQAVLADLKRQYAALMEHLHEQSDLPEITKAFNQNQSELQGNNTGRSTIKSSDVDIDSRPDGQSLEAAQKLLEMEVPDGDVDSVKRWLGEDLIMLL